jgi:hypothetical protein
LTRRRGLRTGTGDDAYQVLEAIIKADDGNGTP